MSPAITLAAGEASQHRPLIITLFAVFVAATLVITVWAGRQTKDAADFYAGGRQFTGFQNGLAVSGDYMSAASFLGIAGAIALFGYDGFLYSIGFLVAWLVALLLVAEPLRNSGRYTMGDVLAYRMRQRPVRTAAGASTIVVSIFYLLAQMAGAGVLVSLLLGITSDGGKIGIVALVGVLMIVYVTIGGMKGTTWVQMVKAVLLIAGAVLLTFLVLMKFDFNISDLLGRAADNSGKGTAFLEPGLKYGATGTTKLDFISLGVALVLGTAGLPHILIRFYTVPTAKAARKSVIWAIGLIGAFYLMTLALGFGAAALIKPGEIIASNKAGNTAAPLLALHLGGVDSNWGAILLATISAVAFATILAVVAGLTLASSSSFAHDIYANVIKKGTATEKQELGAARWATVGIGAVSIVLGAWPAISTWPVWSRSPSRSPPPRTCRPSSTACSGSGSPPPAPCGRSTAAWSPRSAWCCSRRWSPASPPRCSRTSTSTGSRWRTPASSPSRSASCSAWWAPCCPRRHRTPASTRNWRCGP